MITHTPNKLSSTPGVRNQVDAATQAGRPVSPSRSVLNPLGLSEIKITGGMWEQFQSRNAAATLPHIGHWLEKAGWLKNFDHVADGTIATNRTGREFADSEVYKYLEALTWEYGRTGDESLNEIIETVAQRIERAQDGDGYLHTLFGHPGQAPRYSDLEWGHELYSFGHLFQAAVARLRTFGEDRLVQIARRVADHVCIEFGPDGRQGICGHAEVEPALAELGRVTGEQRYIDQAQLFVERHGNKTLADIEFGRSYFQDDASVRQSTVLRGHSVRALYLSAGAIDVAVEREDNELLDAVRTQWVNTLARRTYLTGGMGSHHQDEAFGADFELPPDRSYSETCAGVASIMVAWRLLLNDGLVRDADQIERTLFNVVATALDETGTRFFYTNPLHQRDPGENEAPDAMSPRSNSSQRSAWFNVSCCPPNVARTMASLATYMATTDNVGLQIHQIAPLEIRTQLASGQQISVDVATTYPDNGNVKVTVNEGAATPWALTLRVPAWAQGAELVVDGTVRPVAPGYVTVERAFAAGEVVELRFPIAPRFTAPDPRIDAIRGTVAVEVGPQVMCLESVDLPQGVGLDDFRVDPNQAIDTSAGAAVVSGSSYGFANAAWPYGDVAGQPGATQQVSLVPYRTWGNRGPATMRVWIPTE